MSEKDANAPRPGPAAEREARLAEALRANLRRRKARDRAAAQEQADGES